MEKARCNTELYSNLSEPLNNVKPSNFWGSHHVGVALFHIYPTSHSQTRSEKWPSVWLICNDCLRPSGYFSVLVCSCTVAKKNMRLDQLLLTWPHLDGVVCIYKKSTQNLSAFCSPKHRNVEPLE